MLGTVAWEEFQRMRRGENDCLGYAWLRWDVLGEVYQDGAWRRVHLLVEYEGRGGGVGYDD